MVLSSKKRTLGEINVVHHPHKHVKTQFFFLFLFLFRCMGSYGCTYRMGTLPQVYFRLLSSPRFTNRISFHYIREKMSKRGGKNIATLAVTYTRTRWCISTSGMTKLDLEVCSKVAIIVGTTRFLHSLKK